eukprot:TCONS_00044606-protein
MSNKSTNSDGISKKKIVKKKFRIAIQTLCSPLPTGEKKQPGRIRNTLNRPNPMDQRYRNKALSPPRQKGKTSKNTDLGAKKSQESKIKSWSNGLKNYRKISAEKNHKISNIKKKRDKKKLLKIKNSECRVKNGHTFV